MQLIFVVVGACMGALGLMILFVGCLATGSTRQKVYRAWGARVGGRVSCAVVCSDFVLYTENCSEYHYLKNCTKKTFWFICSIFSPFTFPYGGEVGRCITPCK